MTPDVKYAVKCINVARLKEEDVSVLCDKVDILLLLRECKHITCVYDHFDESPKNSTWSWQQCQGGELFNQIVAKSHYNEWEARTACKILRLCSGKGNRGPRFLVCIDVDVVPPPPTVVVGVVREEQIGIKRVKEMCA